MHHNTVRKVLSDDSELDIQKLAEAHNELNAKPKKRVPSMKRSLEAWQKIKATEQEKEKWRKRIKQVWKKKDP